MYVISYIYEQLHIGQNIAKINQKHERKISEKYSIFVLVNLCTTVVLHII